jgi:hypothetical protein
VLWLWVYILRGSFAGINTLARRKTLNVDLLNVDTPLWPAAQQLHADATNSFRSRSAAKAKRALMSSRISSGKFLPREKKNSQEEQQERI